MKEFVFVSDFDGTMTDRDFYHIIIDKYHKEWGREFYNEWKKSKAIDLSFLNRIFNAINQEEMEIEQEILNIPLDQHVADFINKVTESGGDFIILSAGTSYYIDKILEHRNIHGVKVFSNRGTYKDRGIHIIPDPEYQYYSEKFGIDKERVVQDMLKQYKKVYYAGDSRPDLEASMLAHVVFARGELKELLDDRDVDFIPFDDFDQVYQYMKKQGWLK